MDEKEQLSAFHSALTTEHFVLQTASSSTVSESAARASIYIMSLSTSVVAMGFAAQSRDAFGPFAAAVLPALFVLGLFTVARLVDVSGEYLQYRAGIARIRSYYRALNPEAAAYFGPARPHSIPSLQLGPSIAFLTTTSSMVAFVNNVVAGTGIALFARWILGVGHTFLAVFFGVVGAAVLMAAFLTYQKWRFGMFELVPAGSSEETNAREKGAQ